MSENFSDTIDATPEQRTALVLNVVRRNLDRNTFKSIKEVFGAGGLGINKSRVITQDEHGVFQLKERSFHKIQEHTVTVAVVADGLAELAHLDPEQRTRLVIAAFLHDATKRLEIVINDYRNWLRSPIDKQGVSKNEAHSTIVPLLAEINMNEFDENLAKDDLGEYLSFVDTLTEKFLAIHLADSGLPQTEQEKIKEIAGSDSFGGLKKVIYSMTSLFPPEDSREEVKALRKIVETMENNGKAPNTIHDPQTAWLCALLLYCDDITDGNKIVSIDERLTTLNTAPQYQERNQFGTTIFGANNYVAEAITDKCTALLIAKLLGPGILPDKIPQLILAELQNRIHGH